MPERFSVSVPPVANDICRSAVPAPRYLPERRSTAFPHHYTPGGQTEWTSAHWELANSVLRPSVHPSVRSMFRCMFRLLKISLGSTRTSVRRSFSDHRIYAGRSPNSPSKINLAIPTAIAQHRPVSTVTINIRRSLYIVRSECSP